MLPWGSIDGRPDYDFAQGVTLRVFAPIDGGDVTTVVPSLAGEAAATFSTRRTGATVTVTRTDGAGSWGAQLSGPAVTADGDTISLD